MTKIRVTDRMIPRQFYGATAMNVLVALTLLGKFRDLAEQLEGLRLKWFVEQFLRRCESIRQQIDARFDDKELIVTRNSLRDAIETSRDIIGVGEHAGSST